MSSPVYHFCPHPFIASLAPGGICPLCGPSQVFPPQPEPEQTKSYDTRPPIPESEADDRLAAYEDAREYRTRTAAGARAELAFRHFAEFAKQAWPIVEPATPLEWNWHHEAICTNAQAWFLDWVDKQRALRIRGLAEVTRPSVIQRAQNILFEFPPGTAKSRFIMVLLHGWIWLRWAPFTIKALASSPRVAVRDGDYTLNLIKSDWYQSSFYHHRRYDDKGEPWIIDSEKAWELRDDKCAATNFANTARGERNAMGFTGKITGERAMGLFIDDPHDADDIHSPTKKAAVIDRWDRAIWNRVTDMRTSLRCGVMQRLDAGDWAGHVMRQSAMEGMPKWVMVAVPAEYPDKPEVAAKLGLDKPNVYGYKDPRSKPGEIIHSRRFPPKLLAAEKIRLGSRGYAAIYGQNPESAGGTIFKRENWRFFVLPDRQYTGLAQRPEKCYNGPARILDCDHRGRPLVDRFCISLDCAFKSTAHSSATGLTVLAGKRAEWFVMCDLSKPRTFSECLADLKALYDAIMGDKWILPVPSCPIKVLVEDKANGTAVIDSFQRKIPGIIPINPEGGKVARANATTPQHEAGQIHLLDGAPWVDPYVTEFALFGGQGEGRNDRVDTFSQTLNHYGYSEFEDSLTEW